MASIDATAASKTSIVLRTKKRKTPAAKAAAKKAASEKRVLASRGCVYRFLELGGISEVNGTLYRSDTPAYQDALDKLLGSNDYSLYYQDGSAESNRDLNSFVDDLGPYDQREFLYGEASNEDSDHSDCDAF